MEDVEKTTRETILRARKRGPDEEARPIESPSGLKSKLMKMSRDLKDSRDEVSSASKQKLGYL